MIANGETPAHSELVALGAAIGLFHHLLHRKTSPGVGKSRRLGNLLESIVAVNRRVLLTSCLRYTLGAEFPGRASLYSAGKRQRSRR